MAKKINFDINLTDKQNAVANGVSLNTIRRYRARNKIIRAEKPSRRELSDAKGQKQLRILFATKYKSLINKFAYLLSEKFPTQSYTSYIADIKIWAFICIQKYWDSKKKNLEQYAHIAITYAYNWIRQQMRANTGLIDNDAIEAQYYFDDYCDLEE